MEYLKFHRIKNEIINKLSGIEDGSKLGSLCNDFSKDITVNEQLKEVTGMFEEFQEVAERLAEKEQRG